MFPAHTTDPGLCGSCHHVRIIGNRRGSRFFLCQLAEVDPRFPRYPRLPVLRCSGYSASETEPGVESEATEGA